MEKFLKYLTRFTKAGPRARWIGIPHRVHYHPPIAKPRRGIPYRRGSPSSSSSVRPSPKAHTLFIEDYERYSLRDSFTSFRRFPGQSFTHAHLAASNSTDIRIFLFCNLYSNLLRLKNYRDFRFLLFFFFLDSRRKK